MTPTSTPSEVHVLEDHLGVALGHPPARLAVAGDRPALEPGRVQPPEDPGPALDQRLDLEVLLPHAPVPQVLRQAGHEQIGGLQDVPVGGDDKLLLLSWLCPSCAGTHDLAEDRARVRHAARSCPRIVDQPVGTGNATSVDRGSPRPEGDETVTQAVEAAPTWLDLGRLGRRRRARPHQPAHAGEGPPGRARGRGRHQLLPQPAARLPRRDRAEPAPVPAGARAHRGHGRQSRHLLQRPHERRWTSSATPSTSTSGPTTW